MAVTVRAERPADRAAVRTVVSAAFAQAAEPDLVERPHADGDTALSLVAVADGRVVGHVLFSRMAAPFRALALAPLSVRPDRQSRGSGERLVRAGLERAADDGREAVFVLGEPAYYRRFGFDPALEQGFASPYAGPYLMALALKDTLPGTGGRIEHAPAFADLGQWSRSLRSRPGLPP